MHRLALRICVVTLLALSWAGVVRAQGAAPPADAAELEGAYELVSLTKEVTEPKKYTSKTTSEQLRGLWLFKDGFFSCTEFEAAKGQHSEKYYSTAGRYEVRGKGITLFNDFALSLYEFGRRDSYEFSLSGDVLTLTRSFDIRIPHSVEKGTSTVVLRRLRPNIGMQRTRN